MNAFMKACEIAGPLQLAVRGPSPNESAVRLLHQPFALVGRDQRAEVPLDHKLVSRRHVYLQIVEGQAFWLDLDSRSGTSAEGQLRKFGWLEAGKSIRIRGIAKPGRDRASHRWWLDPTTIKLCPMSPWSF